MTLPDRRTLKLRREPVRYGIKEKERPEALLRTMGQQSALNRARSLREIGVLDKAVASEVGLANQ